MTMAMSIAHRITGAGLYVGVALLAWFLLATSMDAAAFGVASGFLNSILGRLILFGFTWALFHHMLGGIRHFIWDAGYGMDKPERDGLAIATLAGGLALSIIIWAAGLAIFGDTDGLAYWFGPLDDGDCRLNSCGWCLGFGRRCILESAPAWPMT